MLLRETFENIELGKLDADCLDSFPPGLDGKQGK